MKTIREALHSREVAKYVFVIPGLCFFIFAVALPFVRGIGVSFTDWDGVSMTSASVGLGNYIKAFHDKRMLIPLRNTLIFGLLGTIGNTVVSLSMAMLLNKQMGKLTTVARTAAFTPVCFSAILTSFLWGFLYREVFPSLFHVRNPLGNPKIVIPFIILMSLWNTCGINMLIYLSGLKGIPMDYYEAATIDGANSWAKFRNITVPLLMPSFTVCVTLSLTGFLREFAMTLAATNGGPGQASKTVSIYIYENLYKFHKAGYGQAIAIIFCVLLMLIANTVSSFFRKREVEM